MWLEQNGEKKKKANKKPPKIQKTCSKSFKIKNLKRRISMIKDASDKRQDEA